MKIETALYLIPVAISDTPLIDVLPLGNSEIIKEIRYFIVENIRTARRFLKKIDPSIDIGELTFYELNGHTDPREVSSFLEPLRNGMPVGVMSEAGCPGIADPGALAVFAAQKEGMSVIPLVGPSSIILSLMASGLNGQNFTFHGYLPVEDKEREKKIRDLEQISIKYGMTHIFIETPYRNGKMAQSLIQILHPETFLCIAKNITSAEESIKTKTVREWRKIKPKMEKVPTIFLFNCLNPRYNKS